MGSHSEIVTNIIREGCRAILFLFIIIVILVITVALLLAKLFGAF